MIEIDSRVAKPGGGTEKLVKFLARTPAVQSELQRQAERIAARAEIALAEIREDEDYTGDHHSEIKVERGRIDRYVHLDDTRGQFAALSIEFGRQSYTYQRPTKDGGTVTVRVKAMEGKYILTEAANLPIRKKRRR
jgi:hypothetical protein